MYQRNFLLLLSLFIYFFSYPSQAQIISYSNVGQGTPLVLIHAFPTDQRLWTPQQEGLKKNFQVITLDLWGFGNSSVMNNKAITMQMYADEVKELLDQLHIQKAIIGGESMGGYVALAFLEHYPKNVQGLILSDTQAIADTAEIKVKRETTASEILKQGSSNFIKGFIPKALSPAASEQTKATLQLILKTQKATAMAAALRGMAVRHDTSKLLADNNDLPILIITGKEDTLITPYQSANMHALAKTSRLVVIPNAGHLSNLEQPEQWNKAVIDMFSHR